VIRIYCYSQKEGLKKLETLEECLNYINKSEYLLWVDAESPNKEELELLHQHLGFKTPPTEVLEDIEISSKYFEAKDHIHVIFSFLQQQKDEFYNEPVLFFIKNNLIITLHYERIITISLFKRFLKRGNYVLTFADQIMAEILALETERIGNRLEIIGKKIRTIRKTIFENQSPEIIKELAYLDDLNLTLRESINEKQRILQKLIKSTRLSPFTKRELKQIYEDLQSLSDFTSIYMEKIDSIQESLLGLITIKQNEASKIFTLIATLFLPATLIASIYGMNFDYMPLLHSPYGFWFSLALMLIVTGFLLLMLRKKNLV
jgi:magnesium transporter